MPSNHLSLYSPLLPSIFPSIRGFSNQSVICIRWPKYWSLSFRISPSNEYLGLISFRMDWFDLLAVQGTLESLLQHHSSKTSILHILYQLSHQEAHFHWYMIPFILFSWRYHVSVKVGFPGGSASKECTCNAEDSYSAGDLGLISGSRRSPGEGNDNPLHYFLLGKFHGQRSLLGYSPWGRKELDTTECVRTHTQTHTHTHKDITLERPPKKSHQCSVFLAAIIFVLLHLKFPALFTLHSGECCLGFFFHLLPNHKLPGLVHVGATDGKMDLKEKKKKKKKKQSKERVREGSSSYHCFQQPQDSSCPELSKAGSISPFTLPNKCSHCKCKALALFLGYFLDLSFCLCMCLFVVHALVCVSLCVCVLFSLLPIYDYIQKEPGEKKDNV